MFLFQILTMASMICPCQFHHLLRPEPQPQTPSLPSGSDSYSSPLPPASFGTLLSFLMGSWGCSPGPRKRSMSMFLLSYIPGPQIVFLSLKCYVCECYAHRYLCILCPCLMCREIREGVRSSGQMATRLLVGAGH